MPVPAAFDAIRNCSHCRRNTDDNCEAWRQVRKAVAVLKQESRWLAKGVVELRDATVGCAATIYQFAGGLVAYFAPDAADFQEAGELKGNDLPVSFESSISRERQAGRRIRSVAPSGHWASAVITLVEVKCAMLHRIPLGRSPAATR